MWSELFYEDYLKELVLFDVEKDLGEYLFQLFDLLLNIREPNQLEMTEADLDFKKRKNSLAMRVFNNEIRCFFVGYIYKKQDHCGGYFGNNSCENDKEHSLCVRCHDNPLHIHNIIVDDYNRFSHIIDMELIIPSMVKWKEALTTSLRHNSSKCTGKWSIPINEPTSVNLCAPSSCCLSEFPL